MTAVCQHLLGRDPVLLALDVCWPQHAQHVQCSAAAQSAQRRAHASCTGTAAHRGCTSAPAQVLPVCRAGCPTPTLMAVRCAEGRVGTPIHPRRQGIGGHGSETRTEQTSSHRRPTSTVAVGSQREAPVVATNAADDDLPRPARHGHRSHLIAGALRHAAGSRRVTVQCAWLLPGRESCSGPHLNGAAQPVKAWAQVGYRRGSKRGRLIQHWLAQPGALGRCSCAPQPALSNVSRLTVLAAVVHDLQRCLRQPWLGCRAGRCARAGLTRHWQRGREHGHRGPSPGMSGRPDAGVRPDGERGSPEAGLHNGGRDHSPMRSSHQCNGPCSCLSAWMALGWPKCAAS